MTEVRMSVLSRDDEAAIERAIAAAEARTSAEVVVLAVPRSDDYARGRALLAGLGAVVLVTAVDWAWPWIAQAAPRLADALPLDPLAWLLPLQALMALGLWWVGGQIPARWLASDARRSAAVSRRAKQEFFDRGITRTRDRNGVLILVSEQERSLVILADRGVEEALAPKATEAASEATPPAVLTHWAAEAVAGLRQGRGGAALVHVIDQLADALAERFGPRAGDVDELPNQVARGH
jgi:putative membrane protein